MIVVEKGKSLKHFNTFGFDVKCNTFIEYSSEFELSTIWSDALIKPILHIGRGSNILFTKDFDGTVLHSAINCIDIISENEQYMSVAVGSGVLFDDFCKWAAERDLWGIENLSLIPGETGSATVQNIGAYGSEIKDSIVAVRCFDNKILQFIEMKVADCQYGYRDSFFKKEENRGRYIITSTLFKLFKSYNPKLTYKALSERFKEAPSSVLQVRETVISIRNEKLPDPAIIGSAGSFFKNPIVKYDVYERICEKFENVPHYDLCDGTIKIPAAFLIEKCGFKGYAEGNVGVWDKQPLVLVNHSGKGTGTEIINLENKIKAAVKEKFDIELQPEVDHF